MRQRRGAIARTKEAGGKLGRWAEAHAARRWGPSILWRSGRRLWKALADSTVEKILEIPLLTRGQMS